jgi:hypothetical protein
VIASDALDRVRRICLAFPEVSERPSHGAPTWFVRDKKAFVTFWVNGHHDLDFPHLWCAALPGAQEGLIEASPDRCFRPPYVGFRGWVGVRMDGRIPWEDVQRICDDAYRMVAPPALVSRLGS